MQAPAIEFGKAVSAFHEEDYSGAKSICKRLLRNRMVVADAAHLLALIYKLEGNFSRSTSYFEKSLLANPRQAVVLANFANLLVQERDYAKAESLYRRATKLDPGQADALNNWATLLNSQGRFDEAVEVLGGAVEVNPHDARAHMTLGVAMRGKEDYLSSINAFEKAISLAPLPSPLGVLASRELAITYRTMNSPKKATALLGALVNANVRAPEIYFIKACSHYDAGEYSLAEADMRMAIELRPDFIEAHEALSKLYWEQGNEERFLESFENSISRAPGSRELRYSLVRQLVYSGREEQARVVLNCAIEEMEPDANFLHALGVLSLRAKRFEEASGLLDKSLLLSPNSTRFRIDRANLSIRQGDYKSALDDLEKAGRIDPLDQEVWAYLGLVWRLSGDDRAAWLNDYDRLIHVDYLAVPEGYDNLEHFMHELRSVLEALHKTVRQPLDQSVRNGTQTVGRLLSLPDKVIQDYRSTLTRSIKEYIDRLPTDPAHPFLNRKRPEFVHSGSWSVRLGKGGFHTNHVHPKGWLSNCTYVSLPGEIRADDPQKTGWIRFGETSLGLGSLEKPGKVLCPQEGMRVLFPSFMWHGTFPLNSDSYRMTAPSDIMPRH